jgi:hypothetical protein
MSAFPIIPREAEKVAAYKLAAKTNTPDTLRMLYNNISKLSNERKKTILDRLFDITAQPYHDILTALSDDIGEVEDDSDYLEKLMMHSTRLAGKLVVMMITSILVDLTSEGGFSPELVTTLKGYHAHFTDFVKDNMSEIEELPEVIWGDGPDYSNFFVYPEGLHGKSFSTMTVPMLDFCIRENGLQVAYHNYLIDEELDKPLKHDRVVFLNRHLPYFRQY